MLKWLLLPILVFPCVAATVSGAAPRDRDRDRLPDRWERNHHLSATIPSAKRDPDGDRLRNRRELRLRTHPRRADTDRDRLRDGAEVLRFRTNPRKRDTDGDGFSDRCELRKGTNPRKRRSRPKRRCSKAPPSQVLPRTLAPAPLAASPGRPFPRLMATHFGIRDAADGQRLAWWDWVVVGGADTTTVSLTPGLRTYNPNIKITPYVSGTEDNGWEGTSACTVPTNAASGFSTNWWLRNADGSFASFGGGRRLINPTAFVPTNAAGRRWNEHLANWVANCYTQDGVFTDQVIDPSAGWWPGWSFASQFPNVDLDRNGVRDVAEHGATWTNDRWGEAMRDMMARLRAALGPNELIIPNRGDGLTQHNNGGMLEFVDFLDRNGLDMLQKWNANHFGELWSTILSGGSQTDYRKMRYNLTGAMLANHHFGYTNGAAGNYTSLWWYDEYSVNTATGQATGDGSRKGYLGQPTGPPQQLTSGFAAVWRRDFQNGIVLHNQTSSSQTVSLGGTFRRIQGTQDPTVNNGQSGTSVTLPAQDGLILLR
jgi:hypothetical protein